MKRKLYALDTNVLIADPEALFKFQEHDLFIPYTVLEELDNNKTGTGEVARNARAASRNLNAVITHHRDPEQTCIYNQCYPLSEDGKLGMLIFEPINPDTLLQKKTIGDNQILISVIEAIKATEQSKGKSLNTRDYAEVILISKDINMRIKARNLELLTEDYLNDHVISDCEVLPSGHHDLSQVDVVCHNSSVERGVRWRKIEIPKDGYDKEIYLNEFISLRKDGYGQDDNEAQTETLQVFEKENDSTLLVREIVNFKTKESLWGIHALNEEQNMAANLLKDNDIHLVSLLGPAGTGKTILALAASLDMIFEDNDYDEIIFTRATVGTSEEIGFLPGTEEEKLTPWMGAVHDSLEALSLNIQDKNNEQISNKIKIKSINFMRGRSFRNRIIIIDEAQNLTKKEMKLLLTRAGKDTKVICMGNLAQIDSPYLSEATSGLTHSVETLRDWWRGGHLILKQSTRSELAEIAEERL